MFVPNFWYFILSPSLCWCFISGISFWILFFPLLLPNSYPGGALLISEIFHNFVSHRVEAPGIDDVFSREFSQWDLLWNTVFRSVFMCSLVDALTQNFFCYFGPDHPEDSIFLSKKMTHFFSSLISFITTQNLRDILVFW